ncbi:MAG: PhzF family phenazine biosynthesis protein [Pseudomonadota bacterium]
MQSNSLRKLSAFSTKPDGGNPAGVWVGDALPSAKDMQRIAAEVGYSETAFVAPSTGQQRTIRYYSPEAEVPFCGHATIATAVALADDEGDGQFTLATQVGEVPVTTQTVDGIRTASLISVATEHKLPSGDLLADILRTLNWSIDDLDASIPPAIAFAGAHHLVLATTTLSRLDRLEYDFEALKSLMLANDLTTLQLVWRCAAETFHSRNPFPVGGVVEDPATGAAAAAFGGYLRDAGLIDAPAAITLHQGVVMGRPSEIGVQIPAEGGIVVSGAAVPIKD